VNIAVVLAGTCPLSASPQAWPVNTRDLLNQTTIPQLIFLLRRASAVVTVDSGPMHLAAALDTPLLGIHTWSDPRQVGPYRDGASVWKGGAISRVRDMLPSSQPLTAAVPSDKDMESIARWTIDQLTGAPR
jgi:ADP-heptose:LPS heptosyltransferase